MEHLAAAAKVYSLRPRPQGTPRSPARHLASRTGRHAIGACSYKRAFRTNSTLTAHAIKTSLYQKRFLALKLLVPLFLLSGLLLVITFSLQQTRAEAAVGEPTLAHVDGTQTFTHHVNPMTYMRFMHYRGASNEVCYCADYQLHGPSDGGTTYPLGADAVYGPLEYYVEHGYPSTTFISGRNWTPDEAETLTQISIWIYRGSVGLDGSFTDGDGNYFNMHNIDGDPRDSVLFDAAVSFYYEGLDSYVLYGMHFCYLWTQPDTAHQNMLLGLVWNGTGDLMLQKKSAKPEVTDGNENYSLAHAVYGIYRDAACTDLVFSKELSDTGSIKVQNMTPGRYYLKETQAPKGYKLDPNPKMFDLYGLQSVTVTLEDEPWQGKIHIQKTDAWQSISENNSLYSFEGATFAVIKNDASLKQVTQLTTNAQGEATSEELPLGDYRVIELSAPVGYAINGTTFFATLTQEAAEKNAPVLVSIPEDPQYDPGELLIQKQDAETGDTAPLGSASLEGCLFRLSYYASCDDPARLPSNPTKAWTLKTDKEGKTSLRRAAQDPATYLEEGPTMYRNRAGNVVFPLGVVKVEETKAPQGYKLPDDKEWVYVIDGTRDGTLERHVLQDLVVPEQVMRGDLEFVKTNAETQERLHHVPFKITSTTTGESHVVTTDENGFFSSESTNYQHSDNTNANDAALDHDEIDETKLDDASGTWFYGHSNPARVNPVNDSLGAFPYDTYRIQELPCSSNDGLVLVDVQATVKRDRQLIRYGTIDNHAIPEETTTAPQSSPEKMPRTGVSLLSFAGFAGAGFCVLGLAFAKYKKAHPPKNPNGHVW